MVYGTSLIIFLSQEIKLSIIFEYVGFFVFLRYQEKNLHSIEIWLLIKIYMFNEQMKHLSGDKIDHIFATHICFD